jgi:hypothetical protein
MATLVIVVSPEIGGGFATETVTITYVRSGGFPGDQQQMMVQLFCKPFQRRWGRFWANGGICGPLAGSIL